MKTIDQSNNDIEFDPIDIELACKRFLQDQNLYQTVHGEHLLRLLCENFDQREVIASSISHMLGLIPNYVVSVSHSGSISLSPRRYTDYNALAERVVNFLQRKDDWELIDSAIKSASHIRRGPGLWNTQFNILVLIQDSLFLLRVIIDHTQQAITFLNYYQTMADTLDPSLLNGRNLELIWQAHLNGAKLSILNEVLQARNKTYRWHLNQKIVISQTAFALIIENLKYSKSIFYLATYDRGSVFHALQDQITSQPSTSPALCRFLNLFSEHNKYFDHRVLPLLKRNYSKLDAWQGIFDYILPSEDSDIKLALANCLFDLIPLGANAKPYPEIPREVLIPRVQLIKKYAERRFLFQSTYRLIMTQPEIASALIIQWREETIANTPLAMMKHLKFKVTHADKLLERWDLGELQSFTRLDILRITCESHNNLTSLIEQLTTDPTQIQVTTPPSELLAFYGISDQFVLDAMDQHPEHADRLARAATMMRNFQYDFLLPKNFQFIVDHIVDIERTLDALESINNWAVMNSFNACTFSEKEKEQAQKFNFTNFNKPLEPLCEFYLTQYQTMDLLKPHALKAFSTSVRVIDFLTLASSAPEWTPLLRDHFQHSSSETFHIKALMKLHLALKLIMQSYAQPTSNFYRMPLDLLIRVAEYCTDYTAIKFTTDKLTSIVLETLNYWRCTQTAPDLKPLLLRMMIQNQSHQMLELLKSPSSAQRFRQKITQGVFFTVGEQAVNRMDRLRLGNTPVHTDQEREGEITPQSLQ